MIFDLGFFCYHSLCNNHPHLHFLVVIMWNVFKMMVVNFCCPKFSHINNKKKKKKKKKQGHSGSAKANIQRWIISTTKQATNIIPTTTVGLFCFVYVSLTFQKFICLVYIRAVSPIFVWSKNDVPILLFVSGRLKSSTVNST